LGGSDTERGEIATMKRVLRSLTFAAITAALLPIYGFAQGIPFQGAITVAWAGSVPGVISRCGGPIGPNTAQVEAHGVGLTSIGFVSMTLLKTVVIPQGPMQGCATFTALNGDQLFANYIGTENAADAFGFQFGTGTLTFTGGTGQFRGASGKANFTGSFSAIETGSYLFDGRLSF
jgi:hypothetical protein